MSLMRFSVAMPEELLMSFDELVARRGLAKNRSEVIRDLVREALIDEECGTPGEIVMGTLTIVFNHHTSDVREKLDTIQHEFFNNIVSTLHIHMDADTCMETIILKGEASVVKTIADMILGTKGVSHGHLTTTSTGFSAFEYPHEDSDFGHGQHESHSHIHPDATGCTPHTHDHIDAEH